MRIPSSTYRLQFNRDFTFDDARRIVPYLHALGITDCYASSFLRAVPGSSHGYDLADPTGLNPELGSREDFDAYVDALRSHGMGQILDVVPNHMGIGRSANPWWQDVLENGPSSRYAAFFDIDWHPIKRELDNKVLLPILHDQYGSVLENQEIVLTFDAGAFHLSYQEHRLPASPQSHVHVLTHRLSGLIERLGEADPLVHELQSIITALNRMPSPGDLSPDRVAERAREKEVIKRRLAALVDASPVLREFIDENVRLFGGVKGEPRSFDRLDALLNDQAYRLAHWRVASEEINYRRFFDINELAAVRMEDPVVFEAVHRFVFQLVAAGAVTGLRIDHVDGLYDPADYLRRLQAAAGAANGGRPLFIVAEKILTRDETLPADWSVEGTTGYDFLNLLNGLFVDRAGGRRLDDVYARFTRQRIAFDDLVYQNKKLIMHISMASDINVLGHQLNRLSERHRHFRDFTLYSLIHTIKEIIACFPVYRTYVTDGPEAVSDRDQAYIRRAVARAKRRNPAESGLVFDFVRSLLLKQAPDVPEEDRQEQLRFVTKFQQLTSPVMAKGVEDTAFYIYNRLVSLNEVGGDPDTIGSAPETFHERMRQRQARWPHTLSATSTHDTKRGEDVRARLDALSEIPGQWRTRVARWRVLNNRHRADVDGQPAPDRNDEYLLYQTLVGAWPLEPMDPPAHHAFVDRIQAYMAKALKEAKTYTSWLNPNPAYEEAVLRFVGAILAPNSAFLRDFLPFQAEVAQYGMYTSLSQATLKIAAPGVPDFYQGTELWHLRLVDPDNRRPVDYAQRASLLSGFGCATSRHSADRRELVRELVTRRADGRIKLYVTATGLTYRRREAALFAEGDCVGVEIAGEKKAHVCAFVRRLGDRVLIAAVPRLVARLLPDATVPPLGDSVWGNTTLLLPDDLARRQYRNIFTGEVVHPDSGEGVPALRLTEVFDVCPVALLEGGS